MIFLLLGKIQTPVKVGKVGDSYGLIWLLIMGKIQTLVKVGKIKVLFSQ